VSASTTGRCVFDAAHEEAATLDRQGVRFIAISQGIDTDASNPASRLMLTILAGVAEFEREIIRERTLSGMRQARADGKTLGRPFRVFDRDEARRLRDDGSSWRSIAKALGVPVSTVVDACTEMVSPPVVNGRRKQSPKARAV